MPWFAYGYFVRQLDGSIVPAGHDFGPTPDSYKLGDSLGVRGDSEGFVIGMLKGEEAKLAGGYDVFVSTASLGFLRTRRGAAIC